MACPICKCKVTYPYDPDPDSVGIDDEELERCANCGYVFWIEYQLDDDDDEINGVQT